MYTILDAFLGIHEWYRRKRGGTWYYVEVGEYGNGMTSRFENIWLSYKPTEREEEGNECRILKVVEY